MMRPLSEIEQAILKMGLEAEIVRMKNMVPLMKSSSFIEILEERIAAGEQLLKEIRKGKLSIDVPRK